MILVDMSTTKLRIFTSMKSSIVGHVGRWLPSAVLAVISSTSTICRFALIATLSPEIIQSVICYLMASQGALLHLHLRAAKSSNVSAKIYAHGATNF